MLSKHMERFAELAAYENNKLPHLIPPLWSGSLSCFCCKKTVPVGAQPWALQVTCKQAHCPAVDILEQWRSSFAQQENPASEDS